MAAHIPLALSILQAVASQHPSLQNQPAGQAPSAVSAIVSALQGASGPNTTNSNNTKELCEFCHSRPKFMENGHVHPFCGKTCASQSKTKGGTGLPPQQHQHMPGDITTNLCNHCHQRPKRQDGTQISDYCGKTCAGKASNAQNPAPPPPQQQTQAMGIPKGICKVPNCGKPVHIDASSGAPGDFCSITHRKLAQTFCLLCQAAPKEQLSQFCGKFCTEKAESLGPILFEVPHDHVTFKNVADQFYAAWRHPKAPPPTIEHIYKVQGSKKSLAAYRAYQQSVETRGNFRNSGRSPGNENRRFHGTKRECGIGEDLKQTKFCSSTSCSLCSILRHSFDLSLFGKRTKWGRFGKGIYTSSTSSKANDYSKNPPESNLKAVVLAKVIVGRGYKVTENSPNLTAAPPGYDSILGETGGSLNWDELVVYDNDGIRPSYLIMYKV